MDRRLFIAGTVSVLMTYNCSRAREQAGRINRGCRAFSSGNTELKDRIRQTSGNDDFDTLCRKWHNLLMNELRVRPGFCFYADADEPNALAVPETLTDGPDGTVLFGLALLENETGGYVRKNVWPYGVADPLIVPTSMVGGIQMVGCPDCKPYQYPQVLVVLAHELGHILQYKTGMSPDGPWQMEPHADFIAGWGLGRMITKAIDTPLSESLDEFQERAFSETAVASIFMKGDSLFNDPAHHGEPELRAAMVRSGYDSRSLDVMAAFEKGKSMAGINRPRPPL